MANDSPANELHRGPPARSATAGCLAVLSVVVGILLLLPGLCTLVLAAKVGFELGVWVLAIVLIVAGLAFVAGAVKIFSAAKGPVENSLPGPPAVALLTDNDRTVAGGAETAPQRAPPPLDVRDIGGGLIIIGLIVLLIFALLLVTQLR
jgi:hypothetical protein